MAETNKKGLRPGGTNGGDGLFLLGIGFILSALAAYFFFDSVYLDNRGQGGLIGRAIGGRGGGGHGGSTISYGLLFVPFVISVIALFYDASKKWAWFLFFASIVLLAIEFLSGMRPRFSMKSSHLLLLMALFCAGIAMIMRSFRDYGDILSEIKSETEKSDDETIS